MKKAVALTLICALLVMSFAACGDKATEQKEVAQGVLNLETASPEALSLPMANPPEKLTMASTISATSAGQTLSLGDIEAFKEIEKRTGVQVEYQTVTAEKLNLLFASDTLPDMIFTNWQNLGGTYKYATSDQIIALDEYIGRNNPNFVNVLKKDKNAYKDLVDIDGRIYFYPFIREDANLRVYEGYQIRKDWLEKLNLQVPRTIDEMHSVLKAFKEQDPNGNGQADEIPFISDKKTSGIDQAMNWWGIDAFYLDNGKVVCGWTQPEFKEYLSTLSSWYSEGLIDPDYLTTDTTQFKSKAVNEVSGSWYGRAAGVLGTLETTMSTINPNFSIVGIPWLSKDSKNGYAMPSKYIETIVGGIGIAVTTSCKNPELATKWLDYAYSDAGNLLINFGIEGESYTMEDGIPTYTKLITKNPNGLSMGEALARYAIPGNYACEQSLYYFDQFMTGSQKDAIDVWKNGDTSRTLIGLKYTEDEMDIANNRKNEIKTYVSGMQSKFITGKESLDNYDAFLKTVKDMGIEDVVKTMQTAYDRYIGK